MFCQILSEAVMRFFTLRITFLFVPMPVLPLSCLPSIPSCFLSSFSFLFYSDSFPFVAVFAFLSLIVSL